VVRREGRNEAAGNISMRLGAKGPSQVVVTACASSTDALGFALDAIRLGRADVMVSVRASGGFDKIERP